MQTRPELEGIQWSDKMGLTFEAQYSEARRAAPDGHRAHKTSMVSTWAEGTLYEIAEDYTVTTVRDTDSSGRGRFRTFVRHLDGTGNMHRVIMPDQVIRRIVSQTEALKSQARSRSAIEGAATRRANEEDRDPIE